LTLCKQIGSNFERTVAKAPEYCDMDTSEDILLAKCAGKMVKGHKDVKGMLVIRETWLTWEPEDKGSAESVSLSISSIKSAIDRL